MGFAKPHLFSRPESYRNTNKARIHFVNGKVYPKRKPEERNTHLGSHVRKWPSDILFYPHKWQTGVRKSYFRRKLHGQNGFHIRKSNMFIWKKWSLLHPRKNQKKRKNQNDLQNDLLWSNEKLGANETGGNIWFLSKIIYIYIWFKLK